MADDFDSWLEAELHRVYARTGAQAPAGVGRYENVRLHLVSPDGIPFAGKAAIGLAAATLSLGAIGAAAATVVTESTNPQAWGQQVKKAVADCKVALKPGQHGIGDCVSAFARRHGAAQRAGHGQDERSDEANEPNSGNGKKTSHPVVSPSPGFEGQSDSLHGQGGQHRSDRSHGPATEGNSLSHPTPSSH